VFLREAFLSFFIQKAKTDGELPQVISVWPDRQLARASECLSGLPFKRRKR
jgi:hypothetical protein